MENPLKIGSLIIIKESPWVFERSIWNQVGMIVRLERRYVHVLFPAARRTFQFHRMDMENNERYQWTIL
jgi:hypothetical protein